MGSIKWTYQKEMSFPTKVILLAIITFWKFKEFDKFGIVGRPRLNWILKWNFFGKNEDI